MSSQNSETRHRGRPQGYDDLEALEAAMRLFWLHGFEAASIDLLCREMNMPRASLYQRFGDKQGLFLATIAHYAETRVSSVTRELDATSLHAALGGYFNAVALLATADPRARGCLVSCVLADAAGTNIRFRTELATRFEKMESRLSERLLLAQRQGELAADADAEALAAVLSALARGIMVRARAGASREDLQAVARTATLLVSQAPLAA